MTKKNVLYLIFLLVMIVYPFIGSYLQSNDISFSSTKIDSYVADITLDENGDMTIVETWNMDYGTAENYVRFRDFVYAKYADGYPLYQDPANVAAFDTTSASVRVLKDGVEIPVREGFSWENDRDEYGDYVDCYPVRNYCESIFTEMDDHALSLGAVTLEYTYKIVGAVTEYSDVSELNWILFQYAEGKIADASVTVHLPAGGHSVDDIYVWGHSLAAGTIDIVDNHTIEMHLAHVAKDDYIEFRILAPTALFPNVDAKNVVIEDSMNLASLITYEADLADYNNLRITIAQVVLIVAVAGVLIMAVVTYFVYIKYDKEYEPRFQAEFYRELPGDESPAEMSYLYYMKKINDEDVTATLLDLIRRKYVTIEYQGQDMLSADADFTLTLVAGKDRAALLPHEQQILRWFFDVVGNGPTVTTKQIEGYGSIIQRAERFQAEAKQFVRLAKQAGEKRNYFEGTLEAKGKAYAFALIPGAILAVSLLSAVVLSIDNTIAAIVSGVAALAYAIYVGTIKKRTVNGNEAFVKWRAFRNFLVSFGNMNDYPIPSVIVWEHYLVYATSLKCADKVMDQLKVKLPLDEETLSGSTYMGAGYRMRGFYLGYAMGRFQHSISIARTNVQQTIVAYNSSRVGSGGHGGGFGGGGGRSR